MSGRPKYGVGVALALAAAVGLGACGSQSAPAASPTTTTTTTVVTTTTLPSTYTVPDAASFQLRVATNLRSSHFIVPSTVACAMPSQWTAGTTFKCTLAGIGGTGTVGSVEITVNADGTASIRWLR